MIKFKYSQFGTFSVILMLPIFVFSLIMLFTTGLKDLIQGSFFSFLSITFLICLLIFYKLTIYIDDTYFIFKLGVGLITKKYLISDIKSCKAVKNSPLYGIGIRMLPNGWLYNVSGLDAIELTFKNKKSIVRIGTNNPETVSQTLNNLIKYEKYESVSNEKDNTGYYLSFVIIFLALILPTILIIAGNRETVVKTTNKDFTIKGMYGLTIKYSDILQLDTIASLPRIKLRTNGYAFGKTLKGNFALNYGTKVKMYIKKGIPPYIHIKTKDLIIYLNFINPDRTLNLYKQTETIWINEKNK